jgi:hypothetical protein
LIDICYCVLYSVQEVWFVLLFHFKCCLMWFTSSFVCDWYLFSCYCMVFVEFSYWWCFVLLLCVVFGVFALLDFGSDGYLLFERCFFFFLFVCDWNLLLLFVCFYFHFPFLFCVLKPLTQPDDLIFRVDTRCLLITLDLIFDWYLLLRPLFGAGSLICFTVSF